MTRGLPSPIEESYSALCLSLAANLLVHTRDELHRLFEGLAKESEKGGFEGEDADTLQEGLSIGETASIDVTDDVRITFRRTAENAVDVSYFYRPTGELILERTDSESAGGGLKWFEPVFWSVSLNGGPATEQTLLKAIEAEHLFKVNHNERKIVVKTRDLTR